MAGLGRRALAELKEFMTVADVYHYPTQHFDFHWRQLTHTDAPEIEP